MVAHHHPSPTRDARARDVLHARNRLWIAGLRLRPATAWREGVNVLRQATARGVLGPVLLGALRGLPWVAAARRPVPREVDAMFCRVQATPLRRPATRRAGA
ncbi:MAG TPA: hypothetical protein VLU41_07865 [Ideonella sp.]|nr:hypothetical protein [Ideonella sp.]